MSSKPAPFDRYPDRKPPGFGAPGCLCRKSRRTSHGVADVIVWQCPLHRHAWSMPPGVGQEVKALCDEYRRLPEAWEALRKAKIADATLAETLIAHLDRVATLDVVLRKALDPSVAEVFPDSTNVRGARSAHEARIAGARDASDPNSGAGVPDHHQHEEK